MPFKLIPIVVKEVQRSTLSNVDLITFLIEDHVRKRSCRKVKANVLSITRDDNTLPQQEKDHSEIFDFFYDEKVEAAKLDVLSDLETSMIDKSASVTKPNITDRRTKAKRKQS